MLSTMFIELNNPIFGTYPPYFGKCTERNAMQCRVRVCVCECWMKFVCHPEDGAQVHTTKLSNMMFCKYYVPAIWKSIIYPRISATINTWKVQPFRRFAHFRHSLISVICLTAATAMRLLSLLAHSECKTLNEGSVMISACVCALHMESINDTLRHINAVVRLRISVCILVFRSLVAIVTFRCMCWLESHCATLKRQSHGKNAHAHAEAQTPYLDNSMDKIIICWHCCAGFSHCDHSNDFR